LFLFLLAVKVFVFAVKLSDKPDHESLKCKTDEKNQMNEQKKYTKSFSF